MPLPGDWSLYVGGATRVLPEAEEPVGNRLAHRCQHDASNKETEVGRNRLDSRMDTLILS